MKLIKLLILGLCISPIYGQENSELLDMTSRATMANNTRMILSERLSNENPELYQTYRIRVSAACYAKPNTINFVEWQLQYLQDLLNQARKGKEEIYSNGSKK
jgi:hypothetical protein